MQFATKTAKATPATQDKIGPTMFTHLEKRIFTAITTLILGLSLFAIEPMSASANEHTAAKPGSLAVTATGTASAPPDLATLRLSVLREAETAREALSANNDAMANVLASMSDAGIEPTDMQTSGLSIQPIYSKSVKSLAGYETPKITAYAVTNSLTLRVRDLSKLGAILDKSVTLGVNRGGSVQFGHQDPSELIEQARIDAVKAALKKANTLADAAGIELGPIHRMGEQSFGAPQPMAMEAVARSARSAAVPIASGETGYSVTVNVEWDLPK